MKALKATYDVRKCFTGHMEDEEMYNKVRDGELDWKPHVKAEITHYRVPAAVFERLLELDRKQQEESADATHN